MIIDHRPLFLSSMLSVNHVVENDDKPVHY